jgi:hypothetical protein
MPCMEVAAAVESSSSSSSTVNLLSMH